MSITPPEKSGSSLSRGDPPRAGLSFDSLPRFTQPPAEVFEAAKAGDRNAVETIVENYRYLVKWMAGRYFVPGWEFEDQEQTGFVCLLEALQSFDPTKAKFSTYLAKVIGVKLSNHARRDGIIRTPTLDTLALRKTTRKALELARHVASLDRLHPTGDGKHLASVSLNPVVLVLANEERDLARKEVERRIDNLKRIPDLRSRDIVLRRLFGAKLEDIGKHYKITKQCVQQRYKNAMGWLPDPREYDLRLDRFAVGWLPDEDVARLRLGISDGSDLKAVKDCDNFVHKWAYWLQNRIGPFDTEGAVQAGRTAVIVAVRDGEIDHLGRMSKGAKRYVRRAINNVARSTLASKVGVRQKPQIADFGYKDGRRLRAVTLKPAKDKYVRYRRRNIEMGLCPRCGRTPEEYQLCNGCRKEATMEKEAAVCGYKELPVDELPNGPIVIEMEETK